MFLHASWLLLLLLLLLPMLFSCTFYDAGALTYEYVSTIRAEEDHSWRCQVYFRAKKLDSFMDLSGPGMHTYVLLWRSARAPSTRSSACIATDHWRMYAYTFKMNTLAQLLFLLPSLTYLSVVYLYTRTRDTENYTRRYILATIVVRQGKILFMQIQIKFRLEI